MPITINVPGTYATLALAVANAGTDDTILIGPNTITEAATVIIDKKLTIQGTDKATSIITSPGSTIRITASGVIIKDLTVNTSAVSGTIYAVTILGNINTTTFDNVKFTSTVMGANSGNIGLYLDNGDSAYSSGYIISDLSILNCEFTTSWIGIRVATYARTSNVTISNCTFTNHGAQGIYADTYAAATTIAPISLYKELGNVNWNISGCSFTNIGIINESYPGGIFMEKLGNSIIQNCTFTSWKEPHNFNYALLQINIKRASANQYGFNTFNGQNITITGNTFTGFPVTGTSTTPNRLVGVWIQGRNDGNIYSVNPGLIRNLTVTNNTFTDLGSALRISNNIYENSLTIDGNRFTDPTPATGATFRRTGVTVSSPDTLTLTYHGYTAGAQVRFGADVMPDGLISGTVYYVINSSLTTNTFQVSLTSGGSAVSITSGTGTNIYLDGPNISFPLTRKTGITVSSTNTLTLTNHGLKTGSIVVFGAVTMPTGLLTAGTTYYVIYLTDNTFQVSATYNSGSGPGGAVSITALTGAGIYLDPAHGHAVNDAIQIIGGTTAPGIPAGTYYVVSVPNPLYFQISSTLGGTALIPSSLSTASSFNYTSNRYIDLTWVDPKSSIPINITNTSGVNLTNARTATLTGNRLLGSFNVSPKTATSVTGDRTGVTFRKTVTVNATSNILTTSTAHGYIPGDTVLIGSSGTVPTPLSTNTIYYVINPPTPTTTTFQLALTAGGAAIDISNAGSGVFVEGPCLSLTSHGYSVNDAITITGGTLAPGIPAGTYYVKTVPDLNNFTISATQGGAVLIPTNSTSPQSSFTINGPGVIISNAHGFANGSYIGFSGTTGTLPTGLLSGTLYYVKSQTINTFQVSLTTGGTSVNTSGTTGSNVPLHPGTIVLTAHNYVTGDDVTFPTGTLPSNISSSTTYKVIVLNATTFYIGLDTTTPIMPNTSGSSVTVSGPCFVTLASHGFSSNDPVYFTTSSTSILPTGITASTMYYVRPLASPSTSIFQLATVPDGSKVITSGTSSGTNTVNSGALNPLTITISSHGLGSNPIYFTSSGVLPTGITAYTLYYVVTITTNTFQISSTPSGTPINTSGIASGTHILSQYNLNWNGQINVVPNTISINNHGYTNGDAIFFKTSGTLPTGLTATTSYAVNPTLYYVIEATVDTFKVSQVLGGVAVELTGRGLGTHYIYKFFTVDAKMCYFNVISPTVVISDPTITEPQRYSLISSGRVSDNRVILTQSTSVLTENTSQDLYIAPIDTQLSIVDTATNITYDSSAAGSVASNTADMSGVSGVIVSNLPNDAIKVVAGLASPTSEDLSFTIKVFDASGAVITTFATPILIQIKAVYQYTYERADVLLDGITKVTTASYNRVTSIWSFYLSSNSNYELKNTPPCLVKGTKVLTNTGYVNVEELKSGDLIETGDKRFVPVVRLRTTKYNRTTNLTAPYIIEKDAFGENYPRHELKISGRHAIQLKSGLWDIPAESAKENPKVYQVPLGESIVYYHLELPDYEKDTMITNNLVVESFNPGNYRETYVWNAERNGYERKVVKL